MNILITLPKNLIEKIISGDKLYEMRKSQPRNMKIGEDGFFVVEAGTNIVRCWCRVDDVYSTFINYYGACRWSPLVGVPKEWIIRYGMGEIVYMWKIGKVIEFECLCRESLMIDRNPQQFVYTPLSYGESY